MSESKKVTREVLTAALPDHLLDTENGILDRAALGRAIFDALPATPAASAEADATLEDIRRRIHEQVGDDYPLLGLLVDFEAAIRSTLIPDATDAGSREARLDDLIERWHVWNATGDDDLKVMLGLRLMQDAFDALPNLAAAPSTPTTEGLDVERLAMAVHIGCGERSGPHVAADGPDEWDRELAEEYAARYARLGKRP